MSNKRNSPRFPVQVDVHFLVKKDTQTEEEYCGTLLTASPFGVFLQTDITLHKEEIIEVVLPLLEYPLRVVGRVAWVSLKAPLGVGIEFKGLNDAQRLDILYTIESGHWLKGDLGEEPDIFTDDTRDILSDFD